MESKQSQQYKMHGPTLSYHIAFTGCQVHWNQGIHTSLCSLNYVLCSKMPKANNHESIAYPKVKGTLFLTSARMLNAEQFEWFDVDKHNSLNLGLNAETCSPICTKYFSRLIWALQFFSPSLEQYWKKSKLKFVDLKLCHKHPQIIIKPK